MNKFKFGIYMLAWISILTVCTMNVRANPSAITPGMLLLPILMVLLFDFFVDLAVLYTGNRLFTREKMSKPTLLKLVLSIFILGLLIDTIVLFLVHALFGETALAPGFMMAFCMLLLADTWLFRAFTDASSDKKLLLLGTYMGILTNPFLYIWLLEMLY